MTNWKVSREACELYEQLRGQLPSAVRVQADTLFGQLFGFADSDYWPGFADWAIVLKLFSHIWKSGSNC